LKNISIDVADFRQWHAPSLTPNIENVILASATTPGPEVLVGEQILAPLAYYSNTIRHLTLSWTGYTKIPAVLNSLSGLLRFTMISHNVTVLREGSFGPNHVPRYIEMPHWPQLPKTVEPNAFQGDYGGVLIEMRYSGISPQEYIFGEVARSMYNAGSGVLNIGNAGPCGNCEHAWFIRDNRHLLPHIQGECRQMIGLGTFEQAPLELYDDC